MEKNTIELNYEELVDNYWNGLTTVLRGFNADGEFLERWVPDEDMITSIVNLIESAQETDLQQMTILLGKESASQMNQSVLEDEILGLGDLTIENTGDEGLKLIVSSMDEWASFSRIERNYAASIMTAFKGESFEGQPTADDETISITAKSKGVRLALVVSKEHHIISDVRYGGRPSNPEKGVLNRFCALIIGKPILEARDHGILYLEESLRSSHRSSDLKGIVIPEKAEPTLELPLELIRSAYTDYCEATGYAPKANIYTPQPSSEWAAKDDATKQTELNGLLNQFCSERNLEADSFEVLSVEHHKNILIQLNLDLGKVDQSVSLIKLERWLKKQTGEPIELHLEELQDRNAKRTKDRNLGATE